jgi:hypothetical protein
VTYPAGIEPMRIGFGPEVLATASNDPDADDFHTRVLAGGALTVGAPIGEGEQRLVEVVVRVGWVRLEVPDFVNGSSRLVEVKRGVADFDNREGVGLDVEFNIPITKDLGYLFFRATTSQGFKPSPWTATVGYTLPVGNLVDMVVP